MVAMKHARAASTVVPSEDDIFDGIHTSKDVVNEWKENIGAKGPRVERPRI